MLDLANQLQRTLINSASMRFSHELLCLVLFVTKRMIQNVKTLEINKERMQENLFLTADHVLAELYQLYLGINGIPEADALVQRAARAPNLAGKTLRQKIGDLHREAGALLNQHIITQLLLEPQEYRGLAVERTLAVVAEAGEVIDRFVK